MTIHIRRTTTTTTTTTTAVEIAVSHLNQHDAATYKRSASPFPNPLQALERKIERHAREHNMTLEEATHDFLHNCRV